MARQPAVPACLALVFAVLVLLSPALFTSRVLAPEDNVYFEDPFQGLAAPLGLRSPSNTFLFDQYRQFHPDMLLAREQLRQGTLPGWNPYAGAGDPVWASQQHGVGSPFVWPAMIFPFWQSLEWVAALKLLAAAIGMLALLRHLRRSWAASLLGALAFSLCSPVVDWLGHPHTSSYVLLPWLFLMIDRVVAGGRWRDVAGLAIASAACAAGGHPPSAIMVGYMAAAWAVFCVARRRGSGHARRSALVVGGVVLGLALAAVVLVPSLELAMQAGDAKRGGQGPLATLYSFVVPEWWGRPDRSSRALALGPVNYVERTGYFGAIPLIIAAAGLIVRRPNAQQLFFGGLAVVSLLFALSTPLSPVVTHMPLFSHLGLIRWVLGAAFAGAVLAAFGLDALLDRRLDPRMVGVAGLAALLPLVLLFAGPGVADIGATARAFVDTAANPTKNAVESASVLRWTILSAAGIVFLALARDPRRRAAVGLLLVFLVAADLLAYNVGFQSAVPEKLVTPPAVGPIAYAHAHVGHARVGGGAVLGPNLAERFGLRDARIYRSPPLRRRQDLWTALGGAGSDYALMSSSAPRLADVFAVRYVFAPSDTASAASGHFRPIPGVAGLLENPHAYPRAWLAYRWRRASNASEAMQLVKREHDLQAEPVVETSRPPAPAARAQPEAVRFMRDAPDSVSLDVNAAASAQLVLDDAFYPGWKATVDGHHVPIRPANVAFRAVPVPAGHHRVRFSYDPVALAIGIWTSVGAALLIALVSLVRLARRRGLRGAGQRLRRRAAHTRPVAGRAMTAHPDQRDR